jgi:hypothetical protein
VPAPWQHLGDLAALSEQLGVALGGGLSSALASIRRPSCPKGRALLFGDLEW